MAQQARAPAPAPPESTSASTPLFEPPAPLYVECTEAPAKPQYKGHVRLYFPKKGFGFIQANVAHVIPGDIFFHRLQLENLDSQFIKNGSPVSFTLNDGYKLKVDTFTIECNDGPPRKWTPGTAVSEGKQRGTVRWYSTRKGYGFIQPDEGKEIFVHQTNIVKSGFRSLRDGEDVEFNLIEDLHGQQSASSVSGPGGEEVQGGSRLSSATNADALR